MPVFMEFLETRPEPQVASPFYQHPYGGIARDTWVTKEQFCRFFELTEHDVEHMPVNMKWIDIMEGTSECLGFKIQDRRGRRWDFNGMRWNFDRDAPISFRITIIEKGYSRIDKLLEIAPYLGDGFTHVVSN